MLVHGLLLSVKLSLLAAERGGWLDSEWEDV